LGVEAEAIYLREGVTSTRLEPLRVDLRLHRRAESS
jgi:hypothetical protein